MCYHQNPLLWANKLLICTNSLSTFSVQTLWPTFYGGKPRSPPILTHGELLLTPEGGFPWIRTTGFDVWCVVPTGAAPLYFPVLLHLLTGPLDRSAGFRWRSAWLQHYELEKLMQRTQYKRLFFVGRPSLELPRLAFCPFRGPAHDREIPLSHTLKIRISKTRAPCCCHDGVPGY